MGQQKFVQMIRIESDSYLTKNVNSNLITNLKDFVN